jgi:hypothetical protein
MLLIQSRTLYIHDVILLAVRKETLYRQIQTNLDIVTSDEDKLQM